MMVRAQTHRGVRGRAVLLLVVDDADPMVVRRPGLHIEALQVAMRLVRDIGNEVVPLNDVGVCLALRPQEEGLQRGTLISKVEPHRAARIAASDFDNHSSCNGLEDVSVLEVSVRGDAICGRPVR